MKLLDGLCKAVIAAGLNFFLAVALVSALTAQTQIASVAVDDQENLKTPKIARAPAQLQLPAALAKMPSGAPSRKAAAPLSGLVTIMSENFESDFPSGLWKVSASDYTWAKRDCKVHGGAFSAWAAGGGARGGALACGANYPDNVSSSMVYGPFDLSDANYAAVSFWASIQFTDDFRDDFSFLASEDGIDFRGISAAGTSGTWFPYTFALTNVPVLGNLAGKPSVWIAFAFRSDGSNSAPNGVLIDDVVLQKGNVNVPPVLSFFSSPGSDPRAPSGLTFDGANLWCADNENDRLYKLSTTGSIISSFASPGQSPRGLAWDGANLWNADSRNDRIYKLSTSGTEISSFNSPGRVASGLVWHGAGFWLCDLSVDTIWKLDANGNILSSFAAPGTLHAGLAWDGKNLWLVDGETLLIYQMDATGKVLDYYLSPGSFPSSLAWDGANFWVADELEGLIYKVRGQLFANDVGVTDIDLPSAVFVGSANAVNIFVTNSGTAAQSNFPVNYRINNGPIITENFMETLEPGRSTTKTFAAPWTPTSEGLYRFSAWTKLAGDGYSANDTLPVANSVRAFKTDFVERPAPQSLAIKNLQKNAITLQWAAGAFTQIIVGKWNGTSIEDGRNVSFIVNNSRTAIDSFKISWRAPAGLCTVSATTEFRGQAPILNNRFAFGSDASGSFTLPDACGGNFNFSTFIFNCGTVVVNRIWNAAPEMPNPQLIGFKLYRDSRPGVQPVSEKLIQFIRNPNAIGFTDNSMLANGSYYYIVTAQYDAGESVPSNEAQVLVTSVHAQENIPREFSLSQNYPNPFNPTTTIEYALPQAARVELKVYNMYGHEVNILVTGRKEAGKYTVEFNATNLSSGVYFYQLRAGEFMATKKLILLR